MTKPIILWQRERTLSTDDAGLTILNSTNPPQAYFKPGPYEHTSSKLQNRVLPLSYFCIKSLVKTPELIYCYGPPRPYCPPASLGDPDILKALLPLNRQGHFDLGKADPRLWAILVQVYSDLPHSLRTYRTALSDKYTPLLQHVPTTEHFSLLTVLELPGCSHLTDDTIIHLRELHTLCVLDASRSVLSALGIRRLSGTLRWVEGGIDSANRRRGPWQLRILGLHNCKQITNAIYQCLEPFTLLAVVDLRGTSCTWDREKIPPAFFPAVEKQLYHPTSPLEALSLLLKSRGLVPSSDIGVLYIDHLTHANRKCGLHFDKSLDIGYSIMAEESNRATMGYCRTDYSLRFPPSCSPERAPSFQKQPCLDPADDPPRGSSTEEPESGVIDLHTMHAVVAMESDVNVTEYKAKMFYSRRTASTSSSMTHPPRHFPQWGQELLMLYREPPSWSQMQLPPPIAKAASRRQSLDELGTVNRTNEQATKAVQKMWDMLSERHCTVKKGTNDSVKAPSTKLFESRNPFAAPPKSLKPISSLPIPRPPSPSRRVPANDTRFCDKKADMSLACATTGRAEPRKRPKRSASGSNRGFDWSSWGSIT